MTERSAMVVLRALWNEMETQSAQVVRGEVLRTGVPQGRNPAWNLVEAGTFQFGGKPQG
jgi:hypothetical protein